MRYLLVLVAVISAVALLEMAKGCAKIENKEEALLLPVSPIHLSK